MNLIEKLRDTQAPSHRDTLHKLAADTVELLTAQLKASNTAHAATMKELIERLRQKAGQYDEYDWHSVTELEAADALERMEAEKMNLTADIVEIATLRDKLLFDRNAEIERLTTENAALREGLDGWHARYLDCEVEFARLVDVCHAAKLRLATERDAALAASRHETDMCQQALEDLEKMRGESGVLRGLLNEALGVLETITDEQEPDDWMLLMALKGKIGAAIVPQLSLERKSEKTGDLL
jgi:hypothetical protein